MHGGESGEGGMQMLLRLAWAMQPNTRHGARTGPARLACPFYL